MFLQLLQRNQKEAKQYCVVAPHRLYPLGILLLARGATAD